MSATTVAPLGQIDTAGTPRTPFGRLVKVELRKMIDTRSGFWLLAVTGILIALVMLAVLLIAALTDSDMNLSAITLSSIFTAPVSLLVPLLAILAVTSEWGQRTAMVTFSLEPHRLKVVGAKLASAAIVAFAAIALAVALGALTNVLLGEIDGTDVVWDLTLVKFFWMIAAQIAFFAMGFALGTLLRNAPAAISLFYVVALLLPLMLWPALFMIFDWARDILPWVEINTAATPLMTGMDLVGKQVDVGATEYLQFLSAAAIWVVAPLVIGISRLVKAEVK